MLENNSHIVGILGKGKRSAANATCPEVRKVHIFSHSVKKRGQVFLYLTGRVTFNYAFEFIDMSLSRDNRNRHIGIGIPLLSFRPGYQCIVPRRQVADIHLISVL